MIRGCGRGVPMDGDLAEMESFIFRTDNIDLVVLNKAPPAYTVQRY